MSKDTKRAIRLMDTESSYCGYKALTAISVSELKDVLFKAVERHNNFIRSYGWLDHCFVDRKEARLRVDAIARVFDRYTQNFFGLCVNIAWLEWVCVSDLTNERNHKVLCADKVEKHLIENLMDRTLIRYTYQRGRRKDFAFGCTCEPVA